MVNKVQVMEWVCEALRWLRILFWIMCFVSFFLAVFTDFLWGYVLFIFLFSWGVKQLKAFAFVQLRKIRYIEDLMEFGFTPEDARQQWEEEFKARREGEKLRELIQNIYFPENEVDISLYHEDILRRVDEMNNQMLSMVVRKPDFIHKATTFHFRGLSIDDALKKIMRNPLAI